MKTNNLTHKTISLLLVAFLIATTSLFVFQLTATDTVAYASNEIYYSDYGDYTNVTETINYSRKEESTLVRVNNTFPAYYNNNSSLLNACANVAGANLIGFYDRYYANLIPDYTPGVQRGSNYTYYAMSLNLEKKQAVIDDLYVRMGTNSVEPGTNQTGYKNGLTSYVNSKSLSIAYTSVMTNSNLDLSKLNQELSAGKPVSLYLSGYNITSVSDSGTAVTLTKAIYTGNHIMIVYGYQTVNYYNASNVLVSSKTYLYVATGTTHLGYYVLNNNGTINDAESVYIN